MNTLFRKELREQTKVALLGLAIFTVILMGAYKSCMSTLVNFAAGGGGQMQGEQMQPLLSSGLLTPAAFFCAFFGIALGWLQIHAEKHRDLWAYLIHRPITRTAILRSKIAAGMCLYVLGAGLPLLVLVAVAATPGRVAAPFEWAMTLPVLVIFLTGIVCYFAGMLTGLRQARWYGSRGVGLGLAIFASMLAFGVNRILAGASGHCDDRRDFGRGGLGQLSIRRLLPRPVHSGKTCVNSHIRRRRISVLIVAVMWIGHDAVTEFEAGILGLLCRDQERQHLQSDRAHRCGHGNSGFKRQTASG